MRSSSSDTFESCRCSRSRLKPFQFRCPDLKQVANDIPKHSVWLVIRETGVLEGLQTTHNSPVLDSKVDWPCT